MNLNWNLLDAQWRERHDEAQLEALESALDKALYNQGQERDYALLWRWARLSHFRALEALQQSESEDAGAHRKASREAARLHFAQGAHEALEAVLLQPNRVEGHFWAGVNAIEAARLAGTIATARALGAASHHIERAARIDETYHFAAPLRVSGRITHLKPMILGGNLDMAIDLLRRARQIAPQNSTTLLYLAQALRADRQPAEARSVLRALVDAPDDPDWRWEQARDKKLARVLLQPQS